MGVKTGVQRIATVIRWLSYGLFAFGALWLPTFGKENSWIPFAVLGGIGLVLAYIIDGFGRKED